MGPKSKKTDNVEIPTTETIKAKRGRKSKKELMAALNMEYLVKEKEQKKTIQNTINLNVSEIETHVTEDLINMPDSQNNLYENVLNDENKILTQDDNELTNIIITTTDKTEEPKVAKKRGRKPKGGKIIQQVVNRIYELVRTVCGVAQC
jgi:hypothetical protein